MMVGKRWIFLVALVLLMGGISEAQAQGADGDAAQQAAEHFEVGAEYFFEERYGRALVEFRRAYRLTPHPMILYNISLAHLRMGQLEEARQAAVEASQMEGFPPNERVRNDARIAALTTMMATVEVSDEILEAQRAEADAEHLVVEQVEQVEDAAEGGIGVLGWTGVALTGVGAVFLGYAGLVNYQLGAEIESYQDAQARGDREAFLQLRSEIEDATSHGQVALYAGAGAAAVGLTLWILGATTDSPTSSGASLSVEPGVESGSFVKLTGRF